MEHAVWRWMGESQRQNKVEKMECFAFRNAINEFFNHLVFCATAEFVKDIKPSVYIAELHSCWHSDSQAKVNGSWLFPQTISYRNIIITL